MLFSAFSILYSISMIFLCFLYRGKLATLGYEKNMGFQLTSKLIQLTVEA